MHGYIVVGKSNRTVRYFLLTEKKRGNLTKAPLCKFSPAFFDNIPAKKQKACEFVIREGRGDPP